MEMPHAALLRSFRGPIPLQELNVALLKDAFTGYLRASVYGDTLAEGVLIYSSGVPVIAFTSDGKTDRPDNELRSIAAVTAHEESALELFSLNPGQLRLVLDFCREFTIKQQPPPPPKPQPAAVEAPKLQPAPGRRPPKEEKQPGLPEVRGTFVKSESVESLSSFLKSRKDETGHAILIRQDGNGDSDYHILLLKGKVVAAYAPSAKSGGAAYSAYGASLLSRALAAGGMVEFYSVDEPLVSSIIKMYPHIAVTEDASIEPIKREAPAAAPPEPRRQPKGEPPQDSNREPPRESPRPEPKPMEVLRPDGRQYVAYVPPNSAVQRPEPIARPEAAAHGPVTRPPEKSEAPKKFDVLKPAEMPRPLETTKPNASARPGVPAKALFEKGDKPAIGTDGAGTTAQPGIKGDMDDDANYVRTIEKEFIGNVDDLLKRLDLSHLKVLPEKKKRG